MALGVGQAAGLWARAEKHILAAQPTEPVSGRGGKWSVVVEEDSMPVWEFRCKSCGSTFEQLVRSLSSDETLTCPSCHSDDVQRALSVFAAHGRTSRSASASPWCGQCCDTDGACPVDS